MSAILKRAVSLIEKPLNVDDIRFKNGNTEDIITVISEADKEAAHGRTITRFARLLRGGTEKETCRNIWHFVKHNIPYKADTAGYERIRLPNKTIYDAATIGNGGDCKSFSVLIADLCRELGIRCFFRLISQKAGRKIHHVYVVAVLSNERKVYLDAVHHTFNAEPFYVTKKDIDSCSGDNQVSGLINSVIF